MVDAESELQRHQEAHQEIDEQINDLQRQLAEWLKGHPTFRDELELFDEKPGAEVPSISSTRFDVLGEYNDIGDEWSCVFNFGYLQGLIEAHATVDDHTRTPYDDLDTEE